MLFRSEILRLEPQRVYLPLGVGGHVDHQLVRAVGAALLAEPRAWIMPGPDWAGIVTFYEDFPYAWWSNFGQLEDLGDGFLAELPADVSLSPEYADISDQIETKIRGISLYESQLDGLFGGVGPMAEAVRAFGLRVGELGGLAGFAERYWSTVRL